MSPAGSGKGRYAADINVTPFVDVMLVLLIIFMVTAPMMTEGIDVDLPKTRTVEALPVDDGHLLVSVDPAGTVSVDGQPLALEALTDHLRVSAANGKQEVLLRADRTVPYGVIVDVMGRIREAGISRFGVVAERPAEEQK